MAKGEPATAAGASGAGSASLQRGKYEVACPTALDFAVCGDRKPRLGHEGSRADRSAPLMERWARQAGDREGRAVQDRVVGQSRGDRKALDGRSLKDCRRYADWDECRRVPSRG